MLVAIMPALVLGLRPSPGCGSTQLYAPGETTQHTLPSSDVGLAPINRVYQIQVPEFSAPDRAIPLMFIFHPQNGQAISTLNAFGHHYPNFFVVTPQVTLGAANTIPI
jgi:hypothetical protein